MSAFIISTKTMTRCVHAIMAQTDEFCGISTRRASGRVPIARYDEAGQKIGERLFQMNRDAVLVRYPGDDEFASIPEWKYEADTVAPDSFGSVKALDCLHYQCSEGSIPETDPAYAELGQIMANIALAMVRNHPRYASAPWD